MIRFAAQTPAEAPPIYVSRLTLVNFRNYERLDLDLRPGMTLVHGSNGEGKSNLLEAIYLLAIAKSPRATSDRELVRGHDSAANVHTQVAASVSRNGGDLKVQIDLTVGGDADVQPAAPRTVDKSVRINGVTRRASELVGEVNVVMFDATDLQIALGGPQMRRRYLDILIAQLDSKYLRASQKYQRVISQRNHLLKAVRAGRSNPSELDYWDDELVANGGYIVSKRLESIATLSDLTAPLHRDLSGSGDELALDYRPTFASEPGGDESEAAQALREALAATQQRERDAGFTVVGPHRDDLGVIVNGMDAGMFASRGQCRTAVLAMKLAEARHLAERTGQDPILLLDDVLSELDPERRARVLDAAATYEQCVVTTSDVGSVDTRFLQRMATYTVREGLLEPQGVGLA